MIWAGKPKIAHALPVGDRLLRMPSRTRRDEYRAAFAQNDARGFSQAFYRRFGMQVGGYSKKLSLARDADGAGEK